METIRQYLDNMFYGIVLTQRVRQAKERLLEMMEDKYQALISQGYKENEAVGQVISEFGNLQEIAGELDIQQDIQHKQQPGFVRRYLKAHWRLISGLYWPAVTLLYLVISLVTGNWGLGWMVWPIAALLQVVVSGANALR